MNQKMNDAISRSALMDNTEERCPGACDGEPCCFVCKKIRNAPALDVQPVIHARWIIEKDKAIFCDECSHKLPIVIYNIHAFERLAHHLPKYCPECGAKMDAKEG